MITKLANGQIELSPADHGRRMSYKHFATSSWRGGFRYELIDGRLYVAPMPNLPHDDVLEWLNRVLNEYMRSRPDIIDRISTHGRVFVPNRPATTCPEPDFAAYRNFPWSVPRRSRRWQDVSPILVAEVASEDLAKDFGRNVELYEQVPSIQEYWLIHAADDDAQFLFRVYRRRGRKWQKPIDLGIGDKYTTRLLPGFELLINPDA
jgi:Uma2 family endonuclease